jgi:hypothetical protein
LGDVLTQVFLYRYSSGKRSKKLMRARHSSGPTLGEGVPDAVTHSREKLLDIQFLLSQIGHVPG